MKGKIKMLIPLFEINKENVEEKYKLVQERLNKENNDFYLQINSKSTQTKNIKFSFSKNIDIELDKVNYTVNSYGLSTEENIFPLPN